jgi:GNAT superfamily N-acetyltransferase
MELRPGFDLTLTVAKVPRTSVGQAGRLLARAFAADPVITHFLAPSRRGRVALRAFFRATIHENLGYNQVYGAWEDEQLVGVAIWRPPKAGSIGAGRLRWTLDRALVRLLFPLRSRGLYAGFRIVGSLHPKEPYWYLVFVGVDPGRQGQGIGRQLLAPVLGLADVGKATCYLETPFPASRAFYLRLRFELVDQVHVFPGAPPIWTMLRLPLPGSSASNNS